MVYAVILNISDQTSSFGEIIIAQEDSYFISPYCIDGRVTASCPGFIHNIIVNECSKMEHFKGNTQRQELVKAICVQFPREQRNCCPETFSWRSECVHRS